MDESGFLRGYLLIGTTAAAGAAAVIFTDAWWLHMLAFLGVGLAARGTLDAYAEKILDDWKKEEPGACETHRRMLPPRGFRRGSHLCIDPRYPYRPKDRELIEEWKFYKRTAEGACLFIGLLLLVCDILFG